MTFEGQNVEIHFGVRAGHLQPLWEAVAVLASTDYRLVEVAQAAEKERSAAAAGNLKASVAAEWRESSSS